MQILQTWMKLRVTLIFLDGVQIVKVKTTDAERLCFTVVLTTGVKKIENGFTSIQLSPLLIFKNLVKAPPGKYPTGITVLGSKGGDSEVFHDGKNLRETYLESFQYSFSIKRNLFYEWTPLKAILVMKLSRHLQL